MSKKIDNEKIVKVLKEQKEKTRKNTKKTINEYKEFALKGNILAMAIGIVLGTAFPTIVNSLVTSVITPLLSLVTNNVTLTDLFITLHGEKMPTLAQAKASGAIVLSYGDLLNSVLYFFIISFTLFIVVKFMKKIKKNNDDSINETIKTCPYCYGQINIKDTKCPNCKSDLKDKKNRKKKVKRKAKSKIKYNIFNHLLLSR